MAYSERIQLTCDLNWYFIDRFKHICHVASCGSYLPEIIAQDDKSNDKFHKIVQKLPERYEVIRNDGAVEFMRQQGVENLDRCFEDFEYAAKRGLYSFNKCDIYNPRDPFYILMCYPKYSKEDQYPLSDTEHKMITRIHPSVNYWFYHPFKLYNYFAADKIMSVRK